VFDCLFVVFICLYIFFTRFYFDVIIFFSQASANASVPTSLKYEGLKVVAPASEDVRVNFDYCVYKL